MQRLQKQDEYISSAFTLRREIVTTGINVHEYITTFDGHVKQFIKKINLLLLIFKLVRKVYLRKTE